MKPKIIAVTNQKGGPGKTTLAWNLAAAAAARGLSVLLIDVDHQRSLTKIAKGDEWARDLDPRRSIVAAFEGAAPPVAELLVTVYPGIDLIPGHIDLERFNVPEPWGLPRAKQAVLSSLLRRRPRHDLVVIDCHPDLQLLCWAAIVAADGLLIPARPNKLGVHGLAEVLEALDAAVAQVNPGLGLVGIVLNHVDGRKRVARDYCEAIRAAHGSRVLDATIPYLTAFEDSLDRGCPVGLFEPKGRAAMAIDAVAAEVLERLAALDAAEKEAIHG